MHFNTLANIRVFELVLYGFVFMQMFTQICFFFSMTLLERLCPYILFYHLFFYVYMYVRVFVPLLVNGCPRSLSHT